MREIHREVQENDNPGIHSHRKCKRRCAAGRIAWRVSSQIKYLINLFPTTESTDWNDTGLPLRKSGPFKKGGTGESPESHSPHGKVHDIEAACGQVRIKETTVLKMKTHIAPSGAGKQAIEKS